MLREIYDPSFKHNRQSLRIVDYLANEGKGLTSPTMYAAPWSPQRPLRKGWTPKARGTMLRVEDRQVGRHHRLYQPRHGRRSSGQIIKQSDIPAIVSDVLGVSNSQRINTLVTDIIERNWHIAYPGPELAVRDRCTVELTISPHIQEAADILKQFLYQRVYTGSEAKAEIHKIEHLIQTLFDYFCAHIDELPPR